MSELQFHPDVSQDLKEAYIWYESQSSGLGEDFLFELETAFSLIHNMPNSWPIIPTGFRRYLLKRLPYGVIYKVKESYIFVVAVMHLSKRPNSWRKRTK